MVSVDDYYLKPKPVNFTEPPLAKSRRYSYESVRPSMYKKVPMSFNSSFVECWSGGCGKAVGKVTTQNSSVESSLASRCKI